MTPCRPVLPGRTAARSWDSWCSVSCSMEGAIPTQPGKRRRPQRVKSQPQGCPSAKPGSFSQGGLSACQTPPSGQACLPSGHRTCKGTQRSTLLPGAQISGRLQDNGGGGEDPGPGTCAGSRAAPGLRPRAGLSRGPGVQPRSQGRSFNSVRAQAPGRGRGAGGGGAAPRAQRGPGRAPRP